MAGDIKPSRPAHWGFWATITWGAVLSIIFMAVQAVTLLVYAVSRNTNLSESQLAALIRLAGGNGHVISVAMFVSAIVCCGLIVGIIKLKKGSVLTDYLCIRSIPPGVMARWAGYFTVVIILSDLITTSLGRPLVPDSMLAIYATASPVWMIWIAFVIAAPLFEETFFRGFLFRGFESSFMGPIGTILATAGLWAVIHVQYDAYGIATIFLMGLILGAARVFTGSLLVPLGLHAIANLVSTVEAAILASTR